MKKKNSRINKEKKKKKKKKSQHISKYQNMKTI